MMTLEMCEITCIHEEQVTKAKKRLEEVSPLELSRLFKILADENRLKILHALSYEDKLCVCDLANIIEATIANTSHHLQSLKKLGVVNSEKIGKLVYYFMTDPSIPELIKVGKNLKENETDE